MLTISNMPNMVKAKILNASVTRTEDEAKIKREAIKRLLNFLNTGYFPSLL